MLGNIKIKLNSVITQQYQNSDVAYRGFYVIKNMVFVGIEMFYLPSGSGR
jgi:hypothetical protein